MTAEYVLSLAVPRFVASGLVVAVHDGDSATVMLELWDGLTLARPVRLAGVNARELRDPGGPEARDALRGLLPAGAPVVIRTYGRDLYGRDVAHVGRVTTGAPAVPDVGAVLLDAGWVAPYDGRGLARDHVPAWPRQEPT